MEISQITLALLTLYASILGVAIGVLYDVNRIIRVMLGARYRRNLYSKLYSLRLPIIKKPISFEGKRNVALNVVINIGDFLCVISATLGIIVLNYSYNSGRFRFFTVLGFFCGVLIYRLTLCKIIMLICEPIAFLIKYIFLSVLVIISRPLLKIYLFMRKYIKKFAYLCSFTLEKKRKKVYNIEGKVSSAERDKETPRRTQKIMPNRRERKDARYGQK
jgi:hypothetical protein